MTQRKPASEMTDEEKLEALKESGHVQDDGIAPKPEDTPEPEKPKPAEEPEKPAEETKDKPEDSPAADPEKDKAPEKPEEEVTPPAPEKKPEDVRPNPTVPVRPVKYKPISEYTQEKKEWKETVDKANAEIEELKATIAALGPDGQLTPEKARQLQEAERIIAENKEKEHFEKVEWPAVEPSIKEMYPDASPEQIAAIKDTLNTLGHTEQYHDKDLDYVLFKNRKTIDALVTPAAAADAPVPPKPRRTVEGGRPGAGERGELTAKDFEGRKDFADLMTLDDDTRKRIVKEMSPKTYASLTSWIAQEEQKDGLTVQRDGRTIKLK